MGVITRGQKDVNDPIFHPMRNKTNPKVAFGERLRQLRKDAGFSQEGLAHKADLDRSYVGAVERGEVNISLINIYILAKAIGVQPYQLLLPSDSQLAKKERIRKA